MSEDPLGFGGGDANLSRYVNNEPTSYVDPHGLERQRVHIWNPRTGEVREVVIPPGENPREFINRMYPGWLLPENAEKLRPALEPYIVKDPPKRVPDVPHIGPRDVNKGIGFVVGIALGFVPGVGEAQDVYVILDPGSTWSDRLVAGISLGVNAAMGGLPPNFGGPARSAQRLAKEAAEAAAKHADDIIDAVTIRKIFPSIGDPGKQGHVRVVKSEEELTRLFEKLSKGGQPFTPAKNNYKGTLVQLPDGTRIGLRRESTSGGPAIDIYLPDRTLLKIHVQQEKPAR